MSDDGLAPGKRLSEIRQQLGLSQRRAAELSGLTHSAISTIEQDKVSPAISTLQKLLKVYGLSLSEFFAEPEKPDEPQVVINQDDLIEIGSQGGGCYRSEYHGEYAIAQPARGFSATSSQKINDRNTTNVDSPSPRPMIRGSRIFPNTRLMTR